MKGITIMALATLIICASCAKDNNSNPEILTEGDKVALNVSVSDNETATKATISATNEKAVKSLQVYVFRTDGVLDTYGKGTTSSLKLSCSTGAKEVYALVNAEEYSDIKTISQLKAKISNLNQNALDKFVMAGKSPETVNITKESSVVIPVKRLVARIAVGKISNNFTAPAYKNSTLTIKKIYLTNVAGTCEAGVAFGDKSATQIGVWYNKMGYKEEVKELTADPLINKALTVGQSLDGTHAYYTYPNPTATDNTSSSWSPRYTRLVIETELEGKTYYYPISIGNIECNKTYTITTLSLTKPGSDNPEKPISSYECTFSVEVEDWVEGFSKTEII